MKTAEYTFRATKSNNVWRVMTNTHGDKKHDLKARLIAALDTSGRIHNAITSLKEGEQLIITCKLIEYGDN